MDNRINDNNASLQNLENGCTTSSMEDAITTAMARIKITLKDMLAHRPRIFITKKNSNIFNVVTFIYK